MKNISKELENWEKSDIKVFWGEIAPCEHLTQIYENDEVFLSTLEDFTCSGLSSGESVILIATEGHLASLNARIVKRNFDLNKLISNEQYFPIEAKAMLEKFMINNWPDEKLFHKCINEVIIRATKNDRKVRAFGEMVAILWSEGKNGATVQLESLWHQLHSKKRFALYCAYPKSGFTQSAVDSVDKICALHSKIIHGDNSSSPEIYYRNVL